MRPLRRPSSMPARGSVPALRGRLHESNLRPQHGARNPGVIPGKRRRCRDCAADGAYVVGPEDGCVDSVVIGHGRPIANPGAAGRPAVQVIERHNVCLRRASRRIHRIDNVVIRATGAAVTSKVNFAGNIFAAMPPVPRLMLQSRSKPLEFLRGERGSFQRGSLQRGALGLYRYQLNNDRGSRPAIGMRSALP